MMAMIRLCDRCGKEIKEAHHLQLEYAITRAVLWIQNDDEDEIELCGACGAEFASWLKGAKKVEP